MAQGTGTGGVQTRIRHLQEQMNAAVDRFLKNPNPGSGQTFRDLCEKIIDRMYDLLDATYPEEIPVKSSPSPRSPSPRPGLPGIT